MSLAGVAGGGLRILRKCLQQLQKEDCASDRSPQYSTNTSQNDTAHYRPVRKAWASLGLQRAKEEQIHLNGGVMAPSNHRTGWKMPQGIEQEEIKGERVEVVGGE